MIDARKAREIALENYKPANLQYGKIKKCIKGAAESGMFFAEYRCDEYDLKVINDIIAFLERKGFSCSVLSKEGLFQHNTIIRIKF